MKTVAPLETKKSTMRSRMLRASRRFEQPPKMVTTAFDQFLSKAFDSTHVTADLADLGTGISSDAVRESSRHEASVCTPDEMEVKLNDALASLGRCSFLYDTHAVSTDVTLPLHLKKDAGPRTLGELTHLRDVVDNVSSAMLASGHRRSASGDTRVVKQQQHAVRRKPVPAYDADDESGASSRSSSSSSSSTNWHFEGTNSVRSSMQSSRTSLNSAHAVRPVLKHQAVSLPTHLSQVSSTPLRVLEVDEPLNSDADEMEQGIKDEMLTAITYANLPRSHPLRRDSIVIPQLVVRPPRRPVPAALVAAAPPDESPVSLVNVGRTTSAPQLPCIDEMDHSPTLGERVKPVPLILAPTLPPIDTDEELGNMVISPLSAAVTAAANVSMVQLQRDAARAAAAAEESSKACVSAPCTPRDPRTAARRENAESVLWRPATARASTTSTMTAPRTKRASPPPRLPRSRKRPTTVDMGVPLKGLGPTSIDVEALQVLLREAEVTQPLPAEAIMDTTMEESQQVQVLPCFSAAEGWTLMGHVHQVGEVTPRASKAPIAVENMEYLDMPTPRNAEFPLTVALPSAFARAQKERVDALPPSDFARQRSDSMSSAASSSCESDFSSDVPSLASDVSGGGYESDSSATSFSTATSSGSLSSNSSRSGKGKVASQYKPGSRPPMRSILPYVTSGLSPGSSPRSRAGSLPLLLPRNSMDMPHATTALHRRQLSEHVDQHQRTTVLCELRLPLQHIANAEQAQQRKTRHVRERHATLAGKEAFESPLFHHWDQSVKED